MYTMLQMEDGKKDTNTGGTIIGATTVKNLEVHAQGGNDSK